MRLPHLLVQGSLVLLGLLLVAWSARALVGRRSSTLGIGSVLSFGTAGVAVLVWQLPGLVGRPIASPWPTVAESAFFVILGGSLALWTTSVVSEHARRLKAESKRRAQAQEDVEQALERERLLVDVLSHDVRNQLGAAIPLIEVVGLEEPELMEPLEEVRGPLQNACDILDEALLYLRIEEMDLDEADLVSLDEVLTKAVDRTRQAAQGSGVELETALDDVEDVQVYPLLTRAVENLLSNAVKFSPEGETVEVQAGQDGSRLLVAVVDHGPGIDPEDREAFFDRFKSRDQEEESEEGHGLGLAITARIVDAMGGDVCVRKTPGGGATMVVEFEASARGVQLPDEPATSQLEQSPELDVVTCSE